MKIWLIFPLFTLLNCNYDINKNKASTIIAPEPNDHIIIMSIIVLDSLENEVALNISYSIITQTSLLKSYGFNNLEEFDDEVLKPVIRSFIRSEISNISKDSINKIDIEKLKNKLNKQISDGRISFDGKKINSYNFSIGILSIAKQNLQQN
ncbi:hypothetical protein [Crocinitomix catalasitica]|uniref:hypothetical protein n=1 Tax=Crocinitomix catalasitica TaxID=184607 RepID=UPI00048427AE|nr:hypothetical protein [Crocinitomix catalasitica]